MTKVKDYPWCGRGKTARFVSVLKTQGSLNAEAPWDIRMVHKFILLHRKVAVYRQCPVYFVNKQQLSVWIFVRNLGNPF